MTFQLFAWPTFLIVIAIGAAVGFVKPSLFRGIKKLKMWLLYLCVSVIVMIAEHNDAPLSAQYTLSSVQLFITLVVAASVFALIKDSWKKNSPGNL